MSLRAPIYFRGPIKVFCNGHCLFLWPPLRLHLLLLHARQGLLLGGFLHLFALSYFRTPPVGRCRRHPRSADRQHAYFAFDVFVFGVVFAAESSEKRGRYQYDDCRVALTIVLVTRSRVQDSYETSLRSMRAANRSLKNAHSTSRTP